MSLKGIEINYDMIDKIYEANGKHKIRRWAKNNKAEWIIPTVFITSFTVKALSEEITIDEAIQKSIHYLALWTGICIPTDIVYYQLERMEKGKPLKDAAYDQIVNQAQLLRKCNVRTTPEFLMQSKVYHKKYKLEMEKAPGVIRERYIEILSYDLNGNENTTSIKETHQIGTRTYELSVGTPSTQVLVKRYKKVVV